MKTAIIQLRATNNKEKNIKKTLCLVKCAIAQGAKFILLPEMFNFRGRATAKGYRGMAEKIPGPSTKPLMEAAKENKVILLAGSLCETSLGERKVYNTSVLIDARGKIAAKYRKIHLFDAQVGIHRVRESRYFLPGRSPVMATMGRWKIGMSVCFDLRFPELYLAYKRSGADVLCVPSAFTKMTGQDHWEALLRARAIENMCYVLAPNQIGQDNKGIVTYGNSVIIDPWGKILARGSEDREEILFARMDKAFIKEKRRALGFQSAAKINR